MLLTAGMVRPSRAEAADAPTAALSVAGVFASHMVLQRDAPLPVWGWAAPGTTVTVEVGPRRGEAVADSDGCWKVRLGALPAGGPHTLTVRGGGATNTFTDVMVGEVWLCSGQSNMEMHLKACEGGQEAAEAATHSDLRLAAIPRHATNTPRRDVRAPWTRCSPGSAEKFSAVAYFFGRELHQELGVPVGLIKAAVGGSLIEAWIPAVPLPAGGSRAQANSFYNGMIHPLVPFALRGAIWYQGESNRGNGVHYAGLMERMVGAWREAWRQEAWPFYFVQLAPLNYGPSGDKLPLFWEAQARAAKKIPDAGMVVINDLGDGQLHPKNKRDVGLRLARLALAQTYGRTNLVVSGPTYRSMQVEGQKIRLTFDHVGGGLVARDGQPLSWFTIAGADRRFVPAQATIAGDTVVVWSEQVPEPQSVRFAWDQMATPNLMNREGLPCGAFRTGEYEITAISKPADRQ